MIRYYALASAIVKPGVRAQALRRLDGSKFLAKGGFYSERTGQSLLNRP